MRPYNDISILLTVLSFLLLNGCSNTKFLSGDQVLYTGRKEIKVIGDLTKKEIKPAVEMADEITYVEPNNAILGKRVLPPIGLWTYYYLEPDSGKKPGWIYRNLKKDPVLISNVNPTQRNAKIESELFRIGFFNSRSWFEIDTLKRNPRKARISYLIEASEPYRINNILFKPANDKIDSLIVGYKNNLNIKKGDVFNLEIIKSEKQKIATYLVENGYYFFSADYIEIIADTTDYSYQIDLLIRKNEAIPHYVKNTYSVGKITAYIAKIQSDSLYGEKPDTVYYDGVSINGDCNYLKQEAITRCILFREGDRYSLSKHMGTVPLLNNYNVFESVKMQFTVTDSVKHTMALNIELTPKKEVSLSIEANVQAKSTGFAGPMSEITLAHANIAKGANRLQLKLFGGFEWQWGNKDVNDLGANSYNAGINSSIVFPKLLVPWKISKQNSMLIAKTVGSLGYEFVNNVTYYRMTSINTGFGYQWNKQKKVSQMFKPFRINLVSLLETTPEFDSIVNSNPYVKKSFEEQSIFGMEYQFTYDNSNIGKNGFFFQVNAGSSGNILYLIDNAGNKSKPYKFLGNIYSQFIKLSFDFRYYTGTTKNGLALRMYTGNGYSYGNSEVMPYIEQFYSGGSNSLRGFVARSLGPGSYKPEDQNGIIDQTGDIKLEFNAEYRLPLTKLIHSALFFETGNIWLLNEDPNRPGAKFNFNSFANQLAVGTGVGLRFDFNFFVLRTDLGFPLRTPYQTDGKNWLTFNDVFKGWLFNLAIGLPY